MPLAGKELPEFRMLYTSAKLAAKDKEELGAITNADAELVSGLLGPYSTYEKMRAALEGGDKGAIDALDKLVELTDRGWKNKLHHLRLLNPEPAAIKVIDEFDKDYGTINIGGSKSSTPASGEDLPPAGWNP